MSDLFDALRPGTRVVVRFRLEGHGDKTLSDALGTFVGLSRQGERRFVTVDTKRGPVRIDTANITHAKPVPPPPPRRRQSQTD